MPIYSAWTSLKEARVSQSELRRANSTAVWADTAYRPHANLCSLDRRGLVPEFQRREPRGKPMPAHIRRGNATRARVRAKVEHVFAAEKRRNTACIW